MQTTSPVLRRRRAFTLVLLSALVPGSAQWLAGNRGLGRVALWTFAILLALVAAAGAGVLLLRGPTLQLLLREPVINFMRFVTWSSFVGWLLLLGDAWRLARPGGLSRRCRLALTASCLVLSIGAGTMTTLVSSALTATGHLSRILAGGGERTPEAGRYNILLLGVDAAEDREGIRPDSINVASIDATTGRTVIFGLPRNLMGVPFPADSPLHAIHPDGYRCGGDCMLNGIYMLGQEHAASYPGDRDPGVAATTEAVEETLGLRINYYAMVDIAGFQNLIDAMGGIRIDIGRAVPIGGVGSEVTGHIEPGTGVHLDGYHALWFARSRADSDDYERMVRQKCVMAAMVKQLDPALVATRFADLAAAGSDILRTDVGPGEISELVELALAGRELPIETVNFAPPLIETAHPDLELIRTTVAETITASRRRDDPTSPGPTATAATSAAPASPEVADSTSTDHDSSQPDPSPTAEETQQPICRVS